ncbi:MAG: hypothetical protein JWO26_41 [Rhodospirillales bacterium]|nr:hypothetical protein [Rhodospirillales bacterium]
MPDWVVPLLQVLMIDIVLAGDNAIVVGMAAAGLAPEQRSKAILWGIIAATVMRIAFASITAQLLAIVGITLMGGLLLVWVCWKMYRELRHPNVETHLNLDGEEPQGKTLRQAIIQILVADVSMSLDNVLAVAGAAKDHPYILIFGLAISVVLMGVAATLIANLLHKHKWIAWVGLLIIVYVAFDMILSGSVEVANQVPENYAFLMLPMGFLARPDVFPAWLWVAATLVQLIIYTTLVTFVGGLVRDAQRGTKRAHG